MNSFYVGLSAGLGLAICVAMIVLLRPVLKDFYAGRRRQKELAAESAASTQQLRLENWNRRRELYLSFRNAAVGLVEELADGGGRWASFYLARDLLNDVSDRGAPDAAAAARQMCFNCQMMLNSGFSDELSVKFDQAVRRYDLACQDDLADIEQAAWPGDETTQKLIDAEETNEKKESSSRRYFKVER